jgi:hypothetical protein
MVTPPRKSQWHRATFTRPDEKRAAKRPLKVAIAGCGGVAQAKWLPAIRYL